MANENRKRVFLALWPDTDVRQALEKLQDDCALKQARRIATDNLHVTLHFLGDQPVDTIDRLVECAGDTRVQRHTLVLDQVGQFCRNGIVWAGCSTCPSESVELYAELGRVLEGLGIKVEKRRFVPHVTLFRKAMKSMKGFGIPGISWEIDRFVLVESELSASGAKYRILKHFKLLA